MRWVRWAIEDIWVARGLASRLRLKLCKTAHAACSFRVARGLASRLRLKHEGWLYHFVGKGRRQGIGFSPEIETYSRSGTECRSRRSPGDWLLA